MAISWAIETMCKINDLTPDIKGKAVDPDWFLLPKSKQPKPRKRKKANRAKEKV